MVNDKWRIVESLAKKAGVLPATRRKWRVRGVPAAWQIKFVEAAPGLLSFDDFIKGNSLKDGGGASTSSAA
jgi:hypothetical protein